MAYFWAGFITGVIFTSGVIAGAMYTAAVKAMEKKS